MDWISQGHILLLCTCIGVSVTQVQYDSGGYVNCSPATCTNGRCQWSYSGYGCVCNPGYQTYKGSQGFCVDKNECNERPSVCPDGICINYMGTYECRCNRGFKRSSNKKQCVYDPTIPFTNTWGFQEFLTSMGYNEPQKFLAPALRSQAASLPQSSHYSPHQSVYIVPPVVEYPSRFPTTTPRPYPRAAAPGRRQRQSWDVPTDLERPTFLSSNNVRQAGKSASFQSDTFPSRNSYYPVAKPQRERYPITTKGSPPKFSMNMLQHNTPNAFQDQSQSSSQTQYTSRNAQQHVSNNYMQSQYNAHPQTWATPNALLKSSQPYAAQSRSKSVHTWDVPTRGTKDTVGVQHQSAAARRHQTGPMAGTQQHGRYNTLSNVLQQHQQTRQYWSPQMLDQIPVSTGYDRQQHYTGHQTQTAPEYYNQYQSTDNSYSSPYYPSGAYGLEPNQYNTMGSAPTYHGHYNPYDPYRPDTNPVTTYTAPGIKQYTLHATAGGNQGGQHIQTASIANNNGPHSTSTAAVTNTPVPASTPPSSTSPPPPPSTASPTSSPSPPPLPPLSTASPTSPPSPPLHPLSTASPTSPLSPPLPPLSTASPTSPLSPPLPPLSTASPTSPLSPPLPPLSTASPTSPLSPPLPPLSTASPTSPSSTPPPSPPPSPASSTSHPPPPKSPASPTSPPPPLSPHSSTIPPPHPSPANLNPQTTTNPPTLTSSSQSPHTSTTSPSTTTTTLTTSPPNLADVHFTSSPLSNNTTTPPTSSPASSVTPPSTTDTTSDYAFVTPATTIGSGDTGQNVQITVDVDLASFPEVGPPTESLSPSASQATKQNPNESPLIVTTVLSAEATPITETTTTKTTTLPPRPYIPEVNDALLMDILNKKSFIEGGTPSPSAYPTYPAAPTTSYNYHPTSGTSNSVYQVPPAKRPSVDHYSQTYANRISPKYYSKSQQTKHTYTAEQNVRDIQPLQQQTMPANMQAYRQTRPQIYPAASKYQSRYGSRQHRPYNYNVPSYYYNPKSMYNSHALSPSTSTSWYNLPPSRSVRTSNPLQAYLRAPYRQSRDFYTGWNRHSSPRATQGRFRARHPSPSDDIMLAYVLSNVFK